MRTLNDLIYKIDYVHVKLLSNKEDTLFLSYTSVSCYNRFRNLKQNEK